MRCPDCKSKNVVKTGFKVTKEGRKQRLQCNDCGRTFYADKKKARSKRKK